MTIAGGICLNGRFLSATPTGVQRVAMQFLRRLHTGAAEDELLVACPAAGGLNGDPALQARVRHEGRLPPMLWEQATLPQLARGRLLLNLCNMAPFRHRGGVTMIHDAQVYLSPESYSPAFVAWYRFAHPLIGRRSAKILTVSEFSRARLAEAGVAPLEKIVTIHNGVDHVLDVPADPAVVERLGLTPRRYAVALANAQKHKNVAVLLKAFAAPALADIKLILVGGASWAELAGDGEAQPDNVILAGRVSDQELRALLEAATCLAYPSTTEGFGLPPLEAMILGCPAVVAPCGALPEVCGAAVAYAEPHAPEAWAAEISRLADDPALRAALGKAGQAQASQYTWERATASLRRVLAEVQE